MARFKTFQTNFNNGQVDPNIFGRIDAAQYQSAAALMTNCYCMPQGGARKREGFEHVDFVASTNANLTIRTELFDFGTPGSVNQSYIIVFYAEVIKVYDAVNRDLEATLSTNFAANEIYELDFAQSSDVMLIVHPNHAPQNLQRVGDAAWLLDEITFDSIPQHSFPVFASASNLEDIQSINFSGFQNNDSFRLDYDGTLTSILTYNVVQVDADTQNGDVMAAAVQAALRTAAGSNDLTVTAIHTVDVEFLGDFGGEPQVLVTTTFSLLKVEFIGSLIGHGIKLETPTSGITFTSSGGGGISVPPVEDVWSVTRGWPSTVTFFENRLWFGGSLSRPATIWASRTGLFFNFSVEGPEPVADDFIDITIDTDQVNKIQALHADRNLLIFTKGAEFYVNSQPATPETISIKSTSRVGAARAKPVSYDNVTMYITDQGSTVRDFVFDFATDGYISNSITKLASGIMQRPRQIVVQRNNAADEADYIYIRNLDGTAAVFSGDRLNGVNAWSTLEFTGSLESITVTKQGIVWAVFNREINGFIHTVIEVQRDGLFLDSASIASTNAVGVAFDLFQFLNTEVKVIRSDNVDLGFFTVNSIGQLDLGEDNKDIDITVGLLYEFKVKTLPIALAGNQGSIKFDRKRVIRAFVELLESLGVKIVYNGRTRSIKGRTATLQLGQPPPLLTGVQEVFLNGYSRSTQVELTQLAPYPVTILSLGLELEV